MPDRVWGVLKWANLALLVAIALWGADAWTQKRCAGLITSSLTSYHQQAVAPLIKAREAREK